MALAGSLFLVAHAVDAYITGARLGTAT